MLDGLSKKPAEKPCETIDTLVGSKTEVRGNIAFSGGLRIDGKVKGNINGQGQSNSTLVLSEQAEVAGNITVPHIIIKGKIKGNVRCTERIELQPGAEIAGDVHYKVIEIAVGATINGHLSCEQEEVTGKGVVTKLKPVAASSGAEAGPESES
jgi:cytoskeletal protein CcmA (bactofilin family)